MVDPCVIHTFAEELTGKFREEPTACGAISDPSHITCVGNDYGFEYIFSRYIEGVGNEDSLLSVQAGTLEIYLM